MRAKHDATMELSFAEPAGAAPEVSPDEIERLVAYLEGKDWTPRRIIQADLGWDERKVRAVSRASRPRIVSFPGSKGYKRWELCTVPEHDACLKAFRAQRNDMDESLLVYTRAYHSHYRGGLPVPAGR